MTTTKTQKKTSTTKPSTSKKTFTVSEELPINPFTFEVLNLVSKQRTNAKKVEVLRKYDHERFREFLRLAFNPNVTFDTPIPNYRPAVEPAGLNYTYIHNEVPKLYRFIKDHPLRSPDLSEKKLSSLLVVLLESLHKDEASLLVNLFKKDLGVKYLTKQVVMEAFPGI